MKIKFIIILFTISILLFVFTKNSLAAEINSNIYDLTTTTKLEQIKAPSTADTKISLPPFTTITVKKGSFREDVTLSVYEGDFDKIKALIPKGQSPISSYYFVFKNQKGLTVFPSIPLTIESVNNYSNTDTFYYSLLPNITVDKQDQKKWSGNVSVNVILPIKNSGFILATNKILDKNDPALNAEKSITKPQPTPLLKDNTKPQAALLLSKITQNALLPKVSILVIIAGLICITIWLIWRRRKRI